MKMLISSDKNVLNRVLCGFMILQNIKAVGVHLTLELPNNDFISLLFTSLDTFYGQLNLAVFVLCIPGDGCLQELTSLYLCLYNNRNGSFCDIIFVEP
ncbi:hypothetical protein D3C74_467390 [compost metagenome]